MVNLTRINNSPFILNADLIEHIQTTPDTVITLTNGHNYLVLESPAEIIRRVLDFRQKSFDLLAFTSTAPEAGSRI
jgi:flagellar protein FlbD